MSPVDTGLVRVVAPPRRAAPLAVHLAALTPAAAAVAMLVGYLAAGAP